ncbi:hypothetical protein PC117_g10005 [Phytophthora cactorum]|uniref:Secreted protein n=1 Tax=Phytophthora cactorum TaxID=29920 RepID=A0A8T1DKK9_9STRA|nr:hypothetical protein PC117_g10005 [Phytophthora cactorum]
MNVLLIMILGSTGTPAISAVTLVSKPATGSKTEPRSRKLQCTNRSAPKQIESRTRWPNTGFGIPNGFNAHDTLCHLFAGIHVAVPHGPSRSRRRLPHLEWPTDQYLLAVCYAKPADFVERTNRCWSLDLIAFVANRLNMD